jgi:ABC-2 type transport system permease protein
MKRRLWAMMRKEFLHIRRDPRTLYLAIGMPAVLTLLFGYAITMDIVHIPFGVLDQDRTSRSRELVSRFGNTRYFTLRAATRDEAEMRRLLELGKTRLFLVIPPGFARRLERGAQSPVQVLVDGTDSNQGVVALGYARAIAQAATRDLFLEGAKRAGLAGLEQRMPPLEPRMVALFNPELKSQVFVVPGLIAVIMMMMGTMLTALTVSREWERGTMEQLLVTPARPLEIVLGKTAPYFALGLLEMVSVILVGMIFFQVPFRGSHILVLGFSSLFLLTALGVGLLISITARSQQLATQLSFLVSMLPSMILSGFMFPVASMPRIIQAITVLVPAKYFITALRGILLKGNGLPDLWGEGLALLLFALAITFLCARRFRTRLG